MSHPLFLATKFNDKQNAWDVVLMLGNYATKEAADREAGLLRSIVLAGDDQSEKLAGIPHGNR